MFVEKYRVVFFFFGLWNKDKDATADSEVFPAPSWRLPGHHVQEDPESGIIVPHKGGSVGVRSISIFCVCEPAFVLFVSLFC